MKINVINMSEIIEYSKNTTQSETEILSKTFISFYLYFKSISEKNLISSNTIYFLDCALDFSEPVYENNPSTLDYLTAKEFQISQFLQLLEPSYNKIEKVFKATFELPSNLSYEDICELIRNSYIAYASIRYKHNLNNTKLLETTFTEEQLILKLPKYIPDTNTNISEFLEMVSGIKRTSSKGDVFEWFNIFNSKLNIRVIIDSSDGQICTMYINGQEFTDASIKVIKKLKRAIKKGTGFENIEDLQQKNKK